ncbi:MAG TPA: PfkB family carbohydrate kinase [Natronosporangium sp.]
MRERRRVVVVGDLVTDVLAKVAGPIAAGTDTPATIRVGGGGQAANTAAWLASRGVPVTLVAAVGDDSAGRERVAELVAAGVDAAVRTVPGVPTGTLVVLTGGGERTMLADRGAADRLQPADVDAALARLPDTGHLHLSGYPLLGEGSRAAGRRALAAARERGLSTSVDAASVAPLRQVGPAAFLTWVRGVDLLFANADEAALLSPAPAGTVLVVKQGAAGARWLGERVYEVPGEPVPVVDPTGAGDAFAAGLLATWLAGGDPASALRDGVRLGARAVTTLGARPRPARDR